MGHLSEIARRRVAAVLLVAGLVVAGLALTDTGPFDDPPTERERVQATVERFYAAAAEGDFAGYCSLLTPAARRQVRTNAARLLEAAGSLSCSKIVSVGADSLAGLTVRIREVSVSGVRARVEAQLRRAEGGGVESRTMFLDQDEAGDWLISDPG